jgi:hypothetical protein
MHAFISSRTDVTAAVAAKQLMAWSTPGVKFCAAITTRDLNFLIAPSGKRTTLMTRMVLATF